MELSRTLHQRKSCKCVCCCACQFHFHLVSVICCISWTCIRRLLRSHSLCILYTHTTQYHNDIWQLHAFRLLFPISSSIFALCRITTFVCSFYRARSSHFFFSTWHWEDAFDVRWSQLPTASLSPSLSLLSVYFPLLTLLLTIQIKINVARTGDFLLCEMPLTIHRVCNSVCVFMGQINCRLPNMSNLTSKRTMHAPFSPLPFSLFSKLL